MPKRPRATDAERITLFTGKGPYWAAKRNEAIKSGKISDSWIPFYPEQIRSAIEPDTDFQHDFTDYKSKKDNELRRLYNSLKARGDKDELAKVHQELINRGINPVELPKFPDIDDTGESLPGDLTLEEAEADQLRREQQEIEEPTWEDFTTDKLERSARDINTRMAEMNRDSDEYIEAIRDLEEIKKILASRMPVVEPRKGLQSVEGQKVAEEDRKAANRKEDDTDFQHEEALETFEEKVPNPFARSYDWVVDNIRSASDFLKSKSDPLLKDLGQSIQNLVEYAQVNRGLIQESMTPMTNKVESSSDKKEILNQFDAWVRASQNNDAEALAEAQATANDTTKELMEAVRTALDNLGAKMSQLGMMATDPKTGRKVPFKMRPDFLPAILLPKYRDAITNPKDGKAYYTENFLAIAQSIIDSKFTDNGVQLKTPEDVDKYFRKVIKEGNFESGFWGDMGMSKKLPLPMEAYDHSLDAIRKYMDRAAERLAQVEAFTRTDKDGKKVDLFDMILGKGEDSLSSNDPMHRYVASLQRMIYNDRFGKSGLVKTGRTLNSLATGLQLAGPKSVLKNFIGGLTNIANFADLGPAFRGMLDAFDSHERAAATEIATMLGITSDDALRLLSETEVDGLSKYPIVSKIPKFVSYMTTQLMGLKRLGPFNTGALKNFSFNNSENMVRITTLLAAKHQLNTWMQNYDGMSSQSKVFEKFAAEEGIDLNALMTELGWDDIKNSPQTARFLRRMVNRIQGSYRLDQVPRFLDTEYGRFLFKYNKYGFQVGRMFDKQVIGYIRNPETRREGYENLLKYFSIYSGMGMLTATVVRNLFGDDELPSWEEFNRVNRTKEDWEQFTYAAGRFFETLHVLGAMGPISIAHNNLGQFMDYGDSPLSAPGLAVIENSAKRMAKWFWSGKQGDLGDAALDGAKFIKENISLVNQASQAYGELVGEPSIFRNRRVQARARMAVKRFLQASDEVEKEGVSLGSIADVVLKGKGLENRVLTDKVNGYLLEGKPAKAKEAYDYAVAQMVKHGATQEEVDGIKNALSSSIVARRPFAVHGKPSGKKGTALFMQWAEKNMDPKEYAEIKALDDLYIQNAIAAKLINKEWGKQSSYTKALKEHQKGQRPAKVKG